MRLLQHGDPGGVGDGRPGERSALCARAASGAGFQYTPVGAVWAYGIGRGVLSAAARVAGLLLPSDLGLRGSYSGPAELPDGAAFDTAALVAGGLAAAGGILPWWPDVRHILGVLELLGFPEVALRD